MKPASVIIIDSPTDSNLYSAAPSAPSMSAPSRDASLSGHASNPSSIQSSNPESLLQSSSVIPVLSGPAPVNKAIRNRYSFPASGNMSDSLPIITKSSFARSHRGSTASVSWNPVVANDRALVIVIVRKKDSIWVYTYECFY